MPEPPNSAFEQNDSVRSSWKSPLLDGKSRRPNPVAHRTSLAEARPGQMVTVTSIFFQIVRNRCWECGLSEGSVVECLDVTDEKVVLDHPDRGRVVLGRSYARFVLTAPVARSTRLPERSA